MTIKRRQRYPNSIRVHCSTRTSDFGFVLCCLGPLTKQRKHVLTASHFDILKSAEIRIPRVLHAIERKISYSFNGPNNARGALI